MNVPLSWLNICFIDLQGQLQQVTPALAKMLGYHIERLQTLSCFDLLHPQDHQIVQQLLLQLPQTHSEIQIEAKLLHHSGQYHWFLWKIMPQKTGFYAQLTNIDTYKQDATQQIHQQLLRIFDDLDIVVYIVDIDSNEIIYLNQQGKKVFGNIEGQICWKALWNTFEFGMPCQVCYEEKPTVISNDTSVWECYSKHKNKWYLVHNRVISWLEGRLVRLEIAYDISHQKNIEQRLMQSQQRYTLAAKAGKTGVWDWNLYTNEFYIDNTLKTLLGYNDIELPNKLENWFKIIHPEDVPLLNQTSRDYLRGQLSHYEIEHRIFDKAGQIRWMIVRGQMMRDNLGRAYRMIGTATDITARKQAKIALEESERRLQTVINNLPVVLFALNKIGIFTVLRGRGLKELALKEDELVGQSIFERYKNFPVIITDAHRALKGEMFSSVVEMENVIFEVKYTPLTDEQNQLTGTLALAINITERKRFETALRKAKEIAETANHSKSEFLATMSHEIRTPMNGVIGMTQLLANTTLTPHQQHYVKIIQNAGDTLLNVINEVLDFSKIEAGKLTLETVEFELRTLLEEVVNFFAVAAQKKGLEIFCHFSPQLPFYVKGDPTRLRQILNNLIGNAVKFTEQGEITLHVSITKETDNHIELHFLVTDTGIGIKTQALSALFNPFTQADKAITRHYGGTGLGLSITKRLINLMGSDITVKTEKDAGTQFQFDLCFEKVKDSTVDILANASELKGLKVLVVDMSVNSAQIFTELLTTWSIDVTVVENKQKALHFLNTHPDYQIVIVNYHMPHEDGIKLIKKIRKAQTFSHIKIILLIPLEQPVSVDVIIDGYLNKPVCYEQLLECLLIVTGKALTTVQPKIVTPKFKMLYQWRILVAEDNLINQEVIKDMLEQIGCQVTVVDNGLAALETWQQQKFDLIFMDWHMPQLDGIETTYKIREIEQYQHNDPIPIIALTANALTGDRERCVAAGMDDYLTKPFIFKELRHILEIWLEQKDNIDIATLPIPTEKIEEITEKQEKDHYLPVFNFDLLHDMQIEGRNVTWLLELFLRELPNYYASINQAISEKDATALYLAVHKLRGASVSLGAQRIVKLCKHLEKSSKNNAFEDAARYAVMLEMEMQLTQQEIEKQKK